MEEKYIYPFTDYGFARLFGSEANKDLLISLVNTLFKATGEPWVIVDLNYEDTASRGVYINPYKGRIDASCKTSTGENLIVEVQNIIKPFYKNRDDYFNSYPIMELVKRDDWNLDVQGIYMVGLLNCRLWACGYAEDDFCHTDTFNDIGANHPLFNKMRTIFLEVPKFQKTEAELETMFDKWMFVLKNLPRLQDRPAALQEPVFKKLFEQAEVANFSKNELYAYHDSIKNFRDINICFDTARAMAYTEERKRIARNLKADGMSNELIKEATGLTDKEISEL